MIVGTDSLGEPLTIPPESLATAGTAILAMRGAGKSWLNAILVEGLAKLRIPFVIIDPEGEYWTLRVKFSSIIVAGGEHSDIPLDREIASILAKTAIEERLELVLDLSEMRRTDQTQFLALFLNELFFQETELRIPFWVSFEEADLWVPQSGNPPCKTAVLDICQRGRKRGLGFALVSQRPATIDKTALSQAEFRFFKRFQQPHDLRAVKEYLEPFTKQTQHLPGLAVTDALLYAPTISKEPIRFQVAPRISPHGGATPEQIDQIKSSTTILALREKLLRMISKKRQDQDFVGQLQERIRQLEVDLTKRDEEIAKLRLAYDVAEILDTSDYRSVKEPSDRNRESKTSTSFVKEDNFIIFDQIGVDINTGVILGDELANLILNRMEPEERVIFLRLMKLDKRLSVKELSQVTGLGEQRLRRIVNDLVRKGLVKYAGRQRRGHLYIHNKEAICEPG